MRFGITGLVTVALLLLVVCGWRVAVNQRQDYARQVTAATLSVPAPAFAGLDANNELFRLDRYLHRHRVLVVFFSATDATIGSVLLDVWDVLPQLRRADVQVVGVSRALPQIHRQLKRDGDACPFPLVSDVEGTIHERWGVEALPAVFLVDRKGEVAMRDRMLVPVNDVRSLLQELTH